LAYWDEWTDLDRARLGRDPWVAQRLQRLQAVEDWLNESLLQAQGCPPAEELFALAGPQHASELDEARREELREHLRLCASCSAETRTLSLPPPAPILDLPEEFENEPVLAIPAQGLGNELEDELEKEATEASVETSHPRARRFYVLETFLLSAAAVVLVWMLAMREFRTTTLAAENYPQWPTLRSGTDTEPIHPGGKVLAQEPNLLWFGMASVPSSEQASRYGIRVLAHSASAFDPGNLVTTWENPGPSMPAAPGLPPGRYTLEAFAIVQGVELPLGTQELEVCDRPDVQKALASLRGLDRVRYLHREGFLEDARREALQMPESPARDRYLAGNPR